jgi:medium-chain acyl-[acyl-carrier-protein] hydrolase
MAPRLNGCRNQSLHRSSKGIFMEIQPIWREQTRVHSFETDFANLWKPAIFFQWMQEAASNHADHLGVGYHSPLAERMLWVLSRLKVYFHSYPTLLDEIIIETWPRGIQQKIFFTRDYRFWSPQGKLYASASSAYLLIDPVKRRMLLPNQISADMPTNEGLAAVDELLEKIPALDNPMPGHTAAADYSAVDLMGHVNNTRYVEWICNCFPQEKYQQEQIAWLQINYNNEVRPNEIVQLGIQPLKDDPQTYLVEGINQNTDARAFEAALGWQAKSNAE